MRCELSVVSAPQKILAFWLLPAVEEKEFFASLLRGLAQRFDAPVFEPHVTLLGAEVDPFSALHVLKEVCASSAAIELTIAGIEWSSQYTKTLYVQFHPSPAASALSDAVRETLGCTAGYQFNPHLSLLYQELPEKTAREAAAGIRLPFANVKFDAVSVIATPVPIETRADVEAWQTLGACRLTAGNAR